jgi:hypothetical protein
MRTDYGDISVINDPKAEQTIILNHVTKEAQVLPLPKGDEIPKFTPPKLPEGVAAPKPSDVKVEDLGKAVIEGHPVEGKRFTFKPPDPPKPPEMPKIPEMPKPPQAPKLAGMALPKAPAAPAAPELPKEPEPPPLPAVPVVSEVWTSEKLKLPVLTKTTSAAGQQMCHCKYKEGVEPPATLFKIPPEYKMIPPPEPPQLPKPPQPVAKL